jgi:hypothetical protein
MLHLCSCWKRTLVSGGELQRAECSPGSSFSLLEGWGVEWKEILLPGASLFLGHPAPVLMNREHENQRDRGLGLRGNVDLSSPAFDKSLPRWNIFLLNFNQKHKNRLFITGKTNLIVSFPCQSYRYESPTINEQWACSTQEVTEPQEEGGRGWTLWSFDNVFPSTEGWLGKPFDGCW